MLSDEQIRSIITDAMGGMARYTFDEVIYIARAIDFAAQDAANAEIEYLKCAVGKQEELTLAAMKGMEIAQRRAAKREAFIDQLLSEKSGSDIANDILNCSLEHLRATRHGELIKAASLGSYGASPNDVARLIEQERP